MINLIYLGILNDTQLTVAYSYAILIISMIFNTFAVGFAGGLDTLVS